MIFMETYQESIFWAGSKAQAVECLPSKHEPPDFKPQYCHKKKNYFLNHLVT
jgi:hypothetical protein